MARSAAKGLTLSRRLRAINEDVIGKLVMPVFKETGHDVKWLENHLGIPRVNRGDLFFNVVDADTGSLKHLAFGKTGAAAMREAKLVVGERQGCWEELENRSLEAGPYRGRERRCPWPAGHAGFPERAKDARGRRSYLSRHEAAEHDQGNFRAVIRQSP
jgi:hypothetical protein